MDRQLRAPGLPVFYGGGVEALGEPGEIQGGHAPESGRRRHLAGQQVQQVLPAVHEDRDDLVAVEGDEDGPFPSDK